MTTGWLLVVPAAVFTYSAVFSLLMTGSRVRRVVLLFVALSALAVPFTLHSPVWLPGLAAIMLIGSSLRLCDLAFDKKPIVAGRRVLHGVTYMEMRRTPRTKPSFEGDSLLLAVVMVGLTIVGVYLVVELPRSGGPVSFLARWFGAALAAYASFGVFAAVGTLLWRGLGFDLPCLHDHPVKSKTIAEFWGERWNRIVGTWLRMNCFMPLARRRKPHLGLVAAFAVSTLLHVYLAWAALDAKAALYWGIFFMAQIPIFFAERALGVAGWRPVAGRGWTVGVMFLASYFFVEPAIRWIDAIVG